MKFSTAKVSKRSGRKAVLALTVAVLTGLGSLFMFRGLSPYWDMFWMVTVGVVGSGHGGMFGWLIAFREDVGRTALVWSSSICPWQQWRRPGGFLRLRRFHYSGLYAVALPVPTQGL